LSQVQILLTRARRTVGRWTMTVRASSGSAAGKGSFVTSTRSYGLLAFAPFDWIDIVDAATIPLAFDLRATRHRQMIEQVRQRGIETAERLGGLIGGIKRKGHDKAAAVE
jgi:hypothetical protein